MKAKTALVGLIALSSGCAYNLRGTPEENQALTQYNNKVLDKHFTEEAAEELKEIPVSYAVLAHPLAVAFSRRHMLEAMMTGHGYGAITVYNYFKKNKVPEEFIVHENVHHADWKGMIDRDEFVNAWENMRKDIIGRRICLAIDGKIKDMYKGYIEEDDEDEYNDERIAYMSKEITTRPEKIPEEMLDVYSKILKRD